MRRPGFGAAVALALLFHGLAFGAGELWMAWRERRDAAMDIDLARSSLLPPNPFRAEAAPPPPAKEWYVGARLRLAPRPAPPPKVPPKPAPVQEAAAASPPCPAPCPGNPGDWASASQAVRKPEWLDGQITEDDYPEAARLKDITGEVIVQVLLDDQGVVRDVRLVKSADPSLDAETVSKLKAARFSPCEDGTGKPFPCTLLLPINWTLE